MSRITKINKLLCTFLLAIYVAYSLFSLPVKADTAPKKILILNSYHEGLSWTEEETQGIMKVLKAYDSSCCINVEYMDWKNYPTDQNLDNLYRHLQYKYSNKTNDVIIATDDAALQFAVKHQADLFAGAPIVFCGVNKEGIEKLGVEKQKVTGVTEIVDPEGTVKAALTINPDIREIFVLFDNTESGKSTGQKTIQGIQSINPNIKINTLNDKKVEDILTAVSQAPDDSIVLITTYYMDPYGFAVGFEEFARKVSKNSRVPVFHLYEFGMGNGAIGGSMLSGRLQGESAGKLAVRILKGEDVSSIPIQIEKTTRYIFDYLQLQRFGLAVDRVPKGSEVINKPYSFISAHKNLVVTICIIFTLLVGFIIMLVFYLRKTRRMKEELEQQYNELIKAQQKLVLSENRYALLFERMLNGFFIFEPVKNEHGKLVDIRLLSINPGFKAQIGVNTDEITGRTWMEVFGYPNQNLKVYHEILRTGEAKHFETYYAITGIYYLVNAFRINENQVGVIFDNITEYKQAIKEITMLNEDLEQRVLERTEDLQSAVSELEAFTYTVSHDLKSPLRAVDGYSRIMLEDFGIKLGQEGNEILCNIRNICKDMIDMINQLLKYSTTSKEEIFKEKVNLEEAFKTVFNELKSAYPARNIKFTIETGLPVIFADRIMMRQVIYNLLSNAVKFTRNKETANIGVGCTITGAEYVFYIKDNGVGFDMEYAGKLFGIFQRLHTNDEFEGSGIGLVTVKKIILRHGGQVWIEGKPNVGTTVYFTLPLE